MAKRDFTDIAFELVEKDMKSLVATHLVLGDESFMAATLCTIITTYCEKRKIDIKDFSTRIHNVLVDYAEGGMH